MLKINGISIDKPIKKAIFNDNSGLEADSMELVIDTDEIRLFDKNIVYSESGNFSSAIMYVDDWAIIGGNLYIYSKKYENEIKKEYVFKDGNFDSIVGEICDKEGFEYIGNHSEQYKRYDYIYSKGKSSLGLICELAMLENKRIKLKGKKLFIVDLGYEKDIEQVVLSAENGTEHNHERINRLGVLRRGSVGWAKDESVKNDIEKIIYTYNADDIYTARRWARGLLNAENMGKEKVVFDTDTRLTALDKIYVSGNLAPEDYYMISKVSTDILKGESTVTAERMREIAI